MRRYSYHPPRLIDEAEAYARTVASIRTMDRLPGPMRARVRSNWPSEFEMHATAIKWAVFAGEAAKSKAYKRLRSCDFADVHLDFDEDDEDDRRRPLAPLTRAAIADAEIAGVWFASLALLPENAAEFKHAVAMFQRGRRAEAWVDDQRIVAMHARGKSLRTIGENLHGGKLNVEQTEARCRAVAQSLAQIANRPIGAHVRGYGSPRQSPRG